jgi:hypothetical protein
MQVSNQTIKITRRITTPFLESIPEQIKHFDAYIYAVVKRKPGMDVLTQPFGVDVRIDPATFDWNSKTITANIPLNINAGISSIEDLNDDWFESLEASFLALMYGMIP